jgi:chaperonin GroES
MTEEFWFRQHRPNLRRPHCCALFTCEHATPAHENPGIHLIQESTFMNLRPIHDRVIIQRLDEGEQKVGGIIVPDTAKEKPQQGKVIASGAGKIRDDGTRQPPVVKAGDRILFGKYSGQEVRLDGEDYLIMREEDVLGVIGGDTKKRK